MTISANHPTPAAIAIDGHTRVLVLTGAGISAESGLATFRGVGGLWNGQPVEDVATRAGFLRDPARVWSFYCGLRAEAAAAAPNAGHLALAALEQRLLDRFLLVTQNVDGLHLRAGNSSGRTIEFHGSLWRARCSRCNLRPFPHIEYPLVELPVCRLCAPARFSYLRPAIVWFGEPIEPSFDARIEHFIRSARSAGQRLVFLAVGTSGQVYPAAAYVQDARAAGAETWLVNLDPPENVSQFEHFVRGRASVILPCLLTS
jgi:NAD-dependent deacetylase